MIARPDAVAALASERFDVLVVGGGMTGAGVALDAASRGYSVALVERGDYAAGTSSRSSKLIHGGLRYLRNLDFGLVAEALLERSLLVKLAPGMVWPLPVLWPNFGHRPDLVTALGLSFYDLISSARSLQVARRFNPHMRHGRAGWRPMRHRTVAGEEVVRLLPALEGRHPTSGYLFFDAQTDDVRLVLAALREAGRQGAVAANRCEVSRLLEKDGRVTGGRCLDRVAGATFEVRARHVINATGVWADRLRPSDAGDHDVPHISPSRGTHVTVAHAALPVDAGVIVPAGGGRTIFVLPWLGRTLIGTTDNAYHGPLDHVPPDEDDVGYLLDACNAYFSVELGVSDLTGAYAGVRPLITRGPPGRSTDISRSSEVFETGSGLVTITGGKYTTYRRMAAEAVDRIVRRDGRRAPCHSDEICLNQTVAPEELRASGLDHAERIHLVRRYGADAARVAELGRDRPGRIVSDFPDLLTEVRFAAREEQAVTVADALLRRTRLGILDAPTVGTAGADVPRAVARALGEELGWDDARVAHEARRWHDDARAEGVPSRGGSRADEVHARDAPHVHAS